MKKLTKALILLLSVVFLFTSCEGSLSSTLSKMMDPFAKNNLYLGVLVDSNTEKIEALSAIVTNTNQASVTAGDDGKLDLSTAADGSVIKNIDNAFTALTNKNPDFNIEISTNSTDPNMKAIADALTGGILDAKDQSEILKTVNSALNGTKDDQDVIKKMMSETAEESAVSAVQNTYKVGSAVINIAKEAIAESGDATIINILDDLSTQIAKKAESDNVTNGDVLQAQIITNLINTGATVAASSNESMDINDPAMKELIDGAVLLMNSSTVVSGGIDLSGIDFNSIIPTGGKSVEFSNETNDIVYEG